MPKQERLADRVRPGTNGGNFASRRWCAQGVRRPPARGRAAGDPAGLGRHSLGADAIRSALDKEKAANERAANFKITTDAIDKNETTHRVHVFKIYMRYELFNYVLKVYVAYVNST